MRGHGDSGIKNCEGWRASSTMVLLELHVKNYKIGSLMHTMDEEHTADRQLADLTGDDKRRVDVTDMEEYSAILFSIEYTILSYWRNHSRIKDKKVISTLKKLIRNFDDYRESSLAGRISKVVKKALVTAKEKENRTYTYGEVISCLQLLKKIAKIHKAPHGRGYLHWIEAFFEERLPETKREMLEYILKYES
jgi:hypothetical protein